MRFSPIKVLYKCSRYVKYVDFGVKMKNGKKQLVLNKGPEKFIFRYEDGSEGQLLDCLVDQAGDERTDFDWFDAAVLSFKLTQSLIGEADRLLYSEPSDSMQFFTNDND